MNRWIILALAAAAALFSGGCVNRPAQAQAARTQQIVTDPTIAVSVQPVQRQTLYKSLEITGDVTALQDTTVGPKQPGKVLTVLVKDGDTVTAGQLLATQDTSEFIDQLRADQAQLETAQAAVSLAEANLVQARRNAAIGPLKSTSSVVSAESQIRAAQSNLRKLLLGGRPEERAEAKALVSSAKANLDDQQKQYDRLATLVGQGAIAANQLDAQRATLVAAQSQYDSAVAALNIQERGARPEDIEAAQEAIRQAQEALKTAKAQKDLDPLLNDQVNAMKAQVDSAKAQADAARANIANITQQIADMEIRAPFSGKVFGRPIQPGTVAGTSSTIARIIGGQGVYFNGQVPADEVEQIRTGQAVTIKTDGLPGKTFQGHIVAISGTAQDVGRLFDVRVQFDNSKDVFPGMFARGNVQLAEIADATVVPVNAVLSSDNQSYVFVARGNVAKKVIVQPGLSQGQIEQVTGLAAGDPVIVDGQNGLVDGAKVKIMPAPSAASASAHGKESDS